MSLTINTNVSAMIAQRNLSESSMRSQSALAKLSSGERITTSKDDAASLSIASGLRMDLSALRAASQNVSQATSMLQIADGGLAQITDVLGRMKTLASTAQSDQISDTERGFLDTEYQQLVQEVDRIADSTEFNGIELLGGATTLNIDGATVGTDVETADGFVAFDFDTSQRSAGEQVTINYNATTNVMDVVVDDGAGNTVASDSISLSSISGNPFDIGGTDQLTAGTTYDLSFAGAGVSITMNDQFDATTAVTANNTVDVVAGAASASANLDFLVGVDSTDQISASIAVSNAAGLGVGGTSVDSAANAVSASASIDSAIDSLNTNRSDLGATMSRLDFAGSVVSVQVENTEAARSTLQDTDVAQEMSRFTSEQVLVQAGVSMLAQANQQPALLLSLLQ